MTPPAPQPAHGAGTIPNVVAFPNAARPRTDSAPLRIAVIGNYLPRRCGIATFTRDMVEAIAAAAAEATIDVYAMTTADATERYDAPVVATIVEDDPHSYRAAAAAIEAGQPDVIWLQHEFGIFGGEAGAMLFELLERVSAPLAVTLHTVLEAPTPAQNDVMRRLIARASRLVVMSERGRDVLISHYGAEPERVAIVHHGVPDRPLGRTAAQKARRGWQGRAVLMTFGLLGPGKGIEHAIAALPAIVERHPNVLYCIVGATHPNLVAHEGERYRHRLIREAERLGVTEHIRWIDAFLDIGELLDLLEAADIYLTPYPGAGQSTSGTLSYAVALGKAVVSTPYLHARELLADDHGVLVPFDDAGAIAEAVGSLLDDPERLETLKRRAWRHGRSMLWSHFAGKTLELIATIRIPAVAAAPAASRLTAFGSLVRLCDDTGMLQHSAFDIPDRAHGYCIDDNARALMLANRSPDSSPMVERAPVFAAFVNAAWNPERNAFRNFMAYDRSWLEDAGSEDSCGRTLWALAATRVEGRTPGIRAWADRLYRASAGIADGFRSPRARAFAMLGAAMGSQGRPFLRDGCQALVTGFQSASRSGWDWFEPVLAYDNPRLCEALIAGGMALLDRDALNLGLRSLGWLATVQTAPNGHFRPVGSNSFGQIYEAPLPFDQQPVDAWAMIDAAAAAYRATGERRWLGEAQRAWDWFFGRNDRAIALADMRTGGCFDGLTPKGVNLNQGAESVLALHLADVTMAKLMGRGASTPVIANRDSRAISA